MTGRGCLASGALLALMACGGGAAQGGGDAPADAREVLLSACSTQQGIGYLKREYGESYCECWADKALETLSAANYRTLVEASRAELAAADRADREGIVRQHTEIYSTVSTAAQACKGAGSD
ncbi:MAG: hypothetical protein R2909_11660 [Gemmatimonadales bacterium]